MVAIHEVKGGYKVYSILQATGIKVPAQYVSTLPEAFALVISPLTTCGCTPSQILEGEIAQALTEEEKER